MSYKENNKFKYAKYNIWRGQSELMSKNARKANSKQRPDGFIYILKLKGFDIYKIGVSSNVKRRIKDLDNANPFGTQIIQSFWFKNVYNMEEAIHDSFKELHLRKEWFKLSNNELKYLCEDLEKHEKKGLFLIRK